MSIIKEREQIIGSIEKMKEEIEAEIRELSSELDFSYEAFRIAAVENDRSENAAFTDSLKDLSLVNGTIANLYVKRNTILANSLDYSKYNSTGVINVYSTVRLKNIETGESMVFMIMPSGLSDLDKGMLGADSPLGESLIHQVVGKTISTYHRLTQRRVDFYIEEVY